MDHFNFNGKLMRDGTPVIGVSSRGLRYGDGLFETIKCIEGKLVLGDEHFARLWKGMQVLQFKPSTHFTPEHLEKEITFLAKKNRQLARARVRLTIFRGEGNLYDAANHSPNYLIETWALAEDNGAWNSNGLVLGIYPHIKKRADILSPLKHNNYLPYVMAAMFAKENKWNDAILLNTEGRICDTCIANIFIVKNDMVYTPSLPEACVAGVMRNHLIRQLPAMGHTVIEKQLSVEELMDADEIFLTNSIYNIRWVQGIDNRSYGNNLTQKIYTHILPTIS